MRSFGNQQRTHVQLLARERTIANACRVSFDDTDDFANGLRWDSKTGQHPANRAVAARDIWISSKVNVQHGGVGAFDKHGFTVAQCRMEIENCVFNVWTQFLRVIFVTLKFGINVDYATRKQSLMCFNDGSES